jgi:hypothetical protein
VFVGSATAVAGSLLLLLAVVRHAMKRDLQSTMFSSVLLLKQAFEQAESNNGLTLTTNLAATEDIGLLEAVEQWDRSVHGSSGSAPPLSARASVVRASPSRTLRPVGMTQDPRLIADLQGSTTPTTHFSSPIRALLPKKWDLNRPPMSG